MPTSAYRPASGPWAAGGESGTLGESQWRAGRDVREPRWGSWWRRDASARCDGAARGPVMAEDRAVRERHGSVARAAGARVGGLPALAISLRHGDGGRAHGVQSDRAAGLAGSVRAA